MAIEDKTPVTPKTDEAKKAARKARAAKNKAAKQALFQFTQTDEYKKLPEGTRNAIMHFAKAQTRSGGGGANTALLQGLFPKVGASVNELDIFKQTKKGRSEFRKVTRVALKKAEPKDRMWIQFNEEKETWTLVGIGEKAPKGWDGIDPAKGYKDA